MTEENRSFGFLGIGNDFIWLIIIIVIIIFLCSCCGGGGFFRE